MKKLILAAVLATAPALAQADDVFGIWKTIPDDNGYYGHIEMKACGGKICGQLIKSFDGSGAEAQTENTGKMLIKNMVNEGGGNYGGGTAYSPDRDKTYKGKLVLAGNKLTVKGCVAFVCRDGGTWTRVK